jgi:hypothetical protein
MKLTYSYHNFYNVHGESISGRPRIIGEIHQVKGGWQYWSEGKKKHGGEIFPTLQQVKDSLEES